MLINVHCKDGAAPTVVVKDFDGARPFTILELTPVERGGNEHTINIMLGDLAQVAELHARIGAALASPKPCQCQE